MILVLPVLPPRVYAATPLPAMYKESAEQLGWPEFVRTVERVVATLPPPARRSAAILTSNYGEAGALQLLGDALPPVVSGHNAYWDGGPPPDGLTTAIVVSRISPQVWAPSLGACSSAATVDNGIGLANMEQGVTIWICGPMREPWSSAWPSLRHLD